MGDSARGAILERERWNDRTFLNVWALGRTMSGANVVQLPCGVSYRIFLSDQRSKPIEFFNSFGLKPSASALDTDELCSGVAFACQC